MTLHDTLTPERACAALATLGIRLAPADVRLVCRDEKWFVQLPGDRMAWFAATATGRAAMATERRLLRVLEARCGFAVPRVLAESDEGEVDVRAMVPGTHDGDAVLARIRDEPDAAAQVGAALGAILAEQHSCVGAGDVAGWLPRWPSWPEPRSWIRDRLPGVVADRALRAHADDVIAEYEALQGQIAETDRALVHTDLGLHNVSIDPATLRVHGVFDWEAACWADRHLDFRYLVLDVERPDVLNTAVAVYERTTGFRVTRRRVCLYDAACAIGYLAYRVGVPADQTWCGRTLAEDLSWTRQALARVQASPTNA
ncbi:MAG: phosphotransferase [Gemmatimonadaceae bacterium]